VFIVLHPHSKLQKTKTKQFFLGILLCCSDRYIFRM